MPQISIMIKPASGLCNLRCKYCFYADEMKKRSKADFGIMSQETLENVIKKTFEFAEKAVSIAFQGGEPTLAGLGFYESLIDYVNKYNVKNLPVDYAIQTNGMVLNDKWCRFLKEHDFLIGISLDGIKQIHDAFRLDDKGEGTYLRVLNAISLLRKYDIPFNILTVVNNKTAIKPEKIYENYRKNAFLRQQYIACIDPYGEERGCADYSLEPKLYGDFLISLFRLWKEDLYQGKQPYIRQFENYLMIMLGMVPEACEQKGVCSIQNVIEADGTVYPCDFYVFDEFKLGNLNQDSFYDIYKKREESGFIERSMEVIKECEDCPWRNLCRGGCRRHREDAGNFHKNYFCEGYRHFFEETIAEWKQIVNDLRFK